MRRHLLGILGIVLLVLAAVLFPFTTDSNSQLWPSAFLRVGLVLVLLWLAWPELAALSRWAAPVAVVVALVLAVTIKQFRVLIPLLILLGGLWMLGRFLKPRPKHKMKRRISGSSDREVPS